MKKAASIVILLIVLPSLSAWLFYKSDIIAPEGQADSFYEESKESSFDLKAKMPAPGTYQLHKIFSVPALTVLDTTGTLQPLSKYTKGKITLLTFFYQRCSDVDGCPYAMQLFHRVKSKLDRDESLRDRMRFVHISFDPERDTPIMMAGLEKKYVNKDKKNIEWNFLTTPSVDALLPVVDAFGQNVDIAVNTTTKGKELSYAHVLKVFLIDEEGDVREIYSTAYISKEMLLNDIKTLALDKTYQYAGTHKQVK